MTSLLRTIRWAPWDWDRFPDTAANTLSIHSVMWHEVGHALGLGHSTNNTLMATSYTCGYGNRWSIMARDDELGAWARYPGLPKNGEANPPNAGCTG